MSKVNQKYLKDENGEIFSPIVSTESVYGNMNLIGEYDTGSISPYYISGLNISRDFRISLYLAPYSSSSSINPYLKLQDSNSIHYSFVRNFSATNNQGSGNMTSTETNSGGFAVNSTAGFALTERQDAHTSYEIDIINSPGGIVSMHYQGYSISQAGSKIIISSSGYANMSFPIRELVLSRIDSKSVQE